MWLCWVSSSRSAWRGRSGRPADLNQEAAITFALASLLPAVVDAGGPATLTPDSRLLHLAVELPNPLDGVGGFVGQQIVEAATALLKALSRDFLAQLAAPVARYVLSTPDLLAEPTLRTFWLVSLTSLTVCAGLLVALAGLAIIPGSGSRWGQSAREAVGVRLPACLLTASISLPLVALEVAMANRLVAAFVDEGFAAGDNPLWTALSQAVQGDAGAGLALLVTTAVGVVLLVGLVVIGLARWATLWLLVILAPVVMGFALLPGGEGLTRLWWRLQLATVFLPVANAVLLGTYVAMFTSQNSGLVGALAGVAVLALMAKLPSWIAGAAIGVDGGELTGRVRRGGRTGRRVVTTVAGVAGGPATSVVAAAGSGRPGRQVGAAGARVGSQGVGGPHAGSTGGGPPPLRPR